MSNTQDILFRTVGLIVALVLMYFTLDNDWLDNSLDDPARLGALIGIIVAAGLVVYAAMDPNPVLVVLTFIIGFAAGIWALEYLPGGNNLKLGAAVIIGAFFWTWIIPGFPFIRNRITQGNRSSRPRQQHFQDPQAQPAPVQAVPDPQVPAAGSSV